MAHRVAGPVGSVMLAVRRLVVRAVQPLPAPLRRRPMLTAAAAGLATLVTVGSRLTGDPGAAATPAVDGSALANFGTSAGGAFGAAASLPLGAAAGSLDVMDLFFKGFLVLLLLYVTLRVLRRFQTGGATAAGRIQVLESRTIGPKATIHLVAVGDRQLVVGLTPGRMVTLAELSAAELGLTAGDDLDPDADLAEVPEGGHVAAGGRAGRSPLLDLARPADLSLTANVARRIARALR
jgi:flagellar biosynthetic protein FliO